MRATPYALQDADREWVEDRHELDDAVADYHRAVFAGDPPKRCDPRCAWRDPWSYCEHRQTFPDCDLVDFLNEEKI